MSYIPNVHALQPGLGDDDHPQYQTDARGDARYPLRGGSGASGTWGINITGNANTAGSANSSSSAGGGRYVNGRRFWWADVGIKTYIWGATNNGDGRVIWEGHYARSSHNHAGVYSWLFGYNHIDVGTLAGSTGYGPYYVGHGLQGNAPKAAMAAAIYDDGAQSVVASIGNLWDGTNIALTVRNLNASATEACWITQIAWV